MCHTRGRQHDGGISLPGICPNTPRVATVGSAATLYRVLCAPYVFSPSLWSCKVGLLSLPFGKSGNQGLEGFVSCSESYNQIVAQVGCTFPSLLGMSSALIRKAALPWACWGQGQTHSLCLLGFATVLGPLWGFKVTIPRNWLCSPDFNLSRQCRLATILQELASFQRLTKPDRLRSLPWAGKLHYRITVRLQGFPEQPGAGFLTPLIRYSTSQVQGSPDSLWLDPKRQWPDLCGTGCHR